MPQPLGAYPLSISGARIPGAVLRLQSKSGNVMCDPSDVGNGGAPTYVVHTQAVASPAWLINHNLGVRPNSRADSLGGREMLAEIVHTSLNQSYIYFDEPTAGFATCS